MADLISLKGSKYIAKKLVYVCQRCVSAEKFHSPIYGLCNPCRKVERETDKGLGSDAISDANCLGASPGTPFLFQPQPSPISPLHPS